MWVEECKSESTCIIKIVNKKAPHLFCLRIANIYIIKIIITLKNNKMEIVTVKTEKELEEVLKNKNVNRIRVEGPLAQKMRSKAKKKKILAGSLLGASTIALCSIFAAPFTGGTSLIAGAAAWGLTATIGTATIVVSATELAILVGGVLGSLAIMAGFKKITFNKDGSVIMEKG